MKKNITPAHSPCPCGSEETYGSCCGRWHRGLADGHHAPTPEALMRSRYSAYAVGELGYLLATWHASTAPGDLELSPIKWVGLEIRHAAEGGDAGVVEFVARYKVNGKAERMHEISRFIREAVQVGNPAAGQRWYYIDGQHPEDAAP